MKNASNFAFRHFRLVLASAVRTIIVNKGDKSDNVDSWSGCRSSDTRKMTNFVCAVADCKSNSTYSASQYPFMKQVKGWARFPSKKKDHKRRRLWETRCRRGTEWRATRNHAVCSLHFIAWENMQPSPKHPDPVLFLYNGWGKNCADYTSRKQNGAQQYCEKNRPDVSDEVVSRPTYQENEEILQISGIQDWCEAEVCSETPLSISANTGMFH